MGSHGTGCPGAEAQGSAFRSRTLRLVLYVRTASQGRDLHLTAVPETCFSSHQSGAWEQEEEGRAWHCRLSAVRMWLGLPFSLNGRGGQRCGSHCSERTQLFWKHGPNGRCLRVSRQDQAGGSAHLHLSSKRRTGRALGRVPSVRGLAPSLRGTHWVVRGGAAGFAADE